MILLCSVFRLVHCMRDEFDWLSADGGLEVRANTRGVGSVRCDRINEEETASRQNFLFPAAATGVVVSYSNRSPILKAS